MKILIVTQYFWPENFKINDLTSGLIERGYEVTIFTGMPNYPKGSFFSNYSFFGPYKETHPGGYTIYRSPLIPRGRGKAIGLILNYLSFALLGSFFILRLIPVKFDKIFVYETSPITVGIPAIVFKWLKKIPIYFWVTDLWPESIEAVGAIKSKKILNLVGLLVKFIYSQCDHILMSSPGFKDRITIFNVPESKLLYFPQWAEEFYHPLSIPPQLSFFDNHKNSLKLIFAGNIGKAQGFETLIKAAEELKSYQDIHWFILGDGRDKAWAISEVKRLSLTNNFHFLGSFPPTEMSNFFYYADALVVSLKKAEIFSLTIPAKIQSYLACQKPILGSIDGEAAKIITHANAGFVSPAEDFKALSSNILKLKKLSLNHRTELGENALKYSSAIFDRKILINRLEQLLKST